MPIEISPASEWGKELRKWEQHPTKYALDEDGTMRPGNPYVYRPYPRMLYKAQTNASGKAVVSEAAPNSMFYLNAAEYERAVLAAEQFTKSCQRIVADEQEQARAMNEGWRESQAEALAYAEALARAIGQAAAEAAHAARRMTPSAQAEYAAAETQTHEHVTDVVGSSKKTRGRKPKIKPVSAAVVEDDA